MQSKENFADLLNEFMQDSRTFEGKVVKGTIISIHNDMATIDIGMKSEGRVPLKEITGRAGMHEARIGDRIDVYVERLEDRQGEALLSVEKARREASWNSLEEALTSGRHVNGVIFGRVKGGFAVDLDGAIAFLPGSQVDIRPIRDLTPLMNIVQPFKLLKMDKSRSNIVVSRRSVLDESRAEARTELVSNLTEGQVIAGVVKNITDYGAFIDLGGVDAAAQGEQQVVGGQELAAELHARAHRLRHVDQRVEVGAAAHHGELLVLDGVGEGRGRQAHAAVQQVGLVAHLVGGDLLALGH